MNKLNKILKNTLKAILAVSLIVPSVNALTLTSKEVKEGYDIISCQSGEFRRTESVHHYKRCDVGAMFSNMVSMEEYAERMGFKEIVEYKYEIVSNGNAKAHVIIMMKVK